MYALGTMIRKLSLASQEDVTICWSFSLDPGFVLLITNQRWQVNAVFCQSDCYYFAQERQYYRPTKVETNTQPNRLRAGANRMAAFGSIHQG